MPIGISRSVRSHPFFYGHLNVRFSGMRSRPGGHASMRPLKASSCAVEAFIMIHSLRKLAHPAEAASKKSSALGTPGRALSRSPCSEVAIESKGVRVGNSMDILESEAGRKASRKKSYRLISRNTRLAISPRASPSVLPYQQSSRRSPASINVWCAADAHLFCVARRLYTVSIRPAG